MAAISSLVMPGSMSNAPTFPWTTTALLCKNSLSCVNTPSATCLSMDLLPLVVCNRFPQAARLHSALLQPLVTPSPLATLCSPLHSGVIALLRCPVQHSVLAPPRNPPRELFIAQPVANIVQPLVGPLPFQIGQRFPQWRILAQCRQFAEKQRLSPVLGQALGQPRRAPT